MLAKYLGAVAGVVAAAQCFSLSAAARQEVYYSTAGDLAKRCAAADQTIDNALCVWFVWGAAEVVANNPAYGFSVCFPDLSALAVTVDVTRKWLNAHPEQELRPASYAVAAALAEAYPCKQ